MCKTLKGVKLHRCHAVPLLLHRQSQSPAGSTGLHLGPACSQPRPGATSQGMLLLWDLSQSLFFHE